MHENSCRICLNSDEKVLIDLFPYEDVESYANEVEFCSGVELHQHDLLPQKICRICLDKVLSACEIKRQCIETDRLLRQEIKEDPDNNLLKDEEKSRRFQVKDILKSEAGVQIVKQKKIPKLKVKNEQSMKVKFSKELLDEKKMRNRDLKCFICRKVFDKIRIRINHIKEDHAMELLCKICKSKKPSALSAEKCLRDHELGFDYLCQICAKPFRHKYYLLKHQATFHAEDSTADFFACDLCGLTTKYKMNLYRHVKSVHLNRNKFPCPHSKDCPDVFYTTKEGLNIHLYRAHDVQAPVNCSSCRLGFSFVSELKIHRKICGGVSRAPGNGTKNKNFRLYCEVVQNGGYRCKVCQKIFAEKQNWSYHYSSTHRDNRTCHICKKEFTNYTNFYRHVNVQHKKIKKFRCDYQGCGKCFGQKQSMINHINTHTGEKPFTCNLCNFRSGDKSTIVKHKKKMHILQRTVAQP